MDHEHLSCGTPELGMCASDRDMFDRVWKRVMPEERADCPIVVPLPAAVPQEEPVHNSTPLPDLPIPDLPVPDPAPAPALESMPVGAVQGEEAVQEEAPAEAPPIPAQVQTEQDAPQTSTGDDFPSQEAVPCLGTSSAGHGGQLQEDILAELEGWQLYRHLARRVTGSAARSLSALASEKHQQARRLAAAYFLISGVRYWPTDRLAVPRTSSWLGTLRRRFSLEQRMESRYRAAALDTEDACLADLYRELADGCAAHAGVLRVLLENAL